MKKKIILLLSLTVIFVFTFAFTSSAVNNIPELPSEQYAGYINQYLTDNSGQNAIVSYLGLDPLIFQVTILTGNYDILIFDIQTGTTSNAQLTRALSNWYELNNNVDFSSFQDINFDIDINENLASNLNNSYQYSNYEQIKYLLDTIGIYYKENRQNLQSISTLNGQISTLNGQISTLNGTIDDLQYDISLKNNEITRLENEVATSYSKGLEDAEVIENSFISIASMPFYFLKGIFDFEIFGINFFTIIQVILTLIFVGFIIKIFI